LTFTTLFQFVIGTGETSISPWNGIFYNLPLDPAVMYRLAVAAKTSNNRLAATNWQTIGLGGGEFFW